MEDRTAMGITLADGRRLSYSTYGKAGGLPIIMHHGSPGSRISMDDDMYHESGGGTFTLACIAYQPQRFHSASLIATVAPLEIPNYKKDMAFSNKVGYWMHKYAPFLVRGVSKNFANNFKKNPNKVWKQITKQLCQADQKIIQNSLESGLYQVFLDHILEGFKNGVEGHITDMRIISGHWDIPYEAILCPIYMWHGEDDTLSPIAGARALAQWLPNTSTHFIPGSGHLLADDMAIMRKILTQILNTQQ